MFENLHLEISFPSCKGYADCLAIEINTFTNSEHFKIIISFQVQLLFFYVLRFSQLVIFVIKFLDMDCVRV
jgi:hypothetical protein